MNHGIFTFGNSAKESYDRMIKLVSKAEDYLMTHSAWDVKISEIPEAHSIQVNKIAELRQKISNVAGKSMLFHITNSKPGLSFSNNKHVQSIATRGPLTPDHVIRTKRIPLIGRDIDSFKTEYAYVFCSGEFISPSGGPCHMASIKTVSTPAFLALLIAARGFFINFVFLKDAA